MSRRNAPAPDSVTAEPDTEAAAAGVRSLAIFGVRVDDVTYDEALALCEEYIREGGPHLIATVNTEFVMQARRDPEFRRVLNEAALAVPDGVGLLAAARLCGVPLREHVRGTDLVDRLAALAAARGYRFFLLGGRHGAAEAAAETLTRRWSGLQVVGTFEGSSYPEADGETVAAVKAAGPSDVLLVAYGAPAQESWILRNEAAVGAPVAVGVGGVFNFFSGRAPRAPRWVQRLELEWLYRLITQPWRWRRQLALPRFVLSVLVSLLLRRTVVRDLGPRRAAGGDGHQRHGDDA
ncbi:MAG: WecB/TagA/CpsF family glycosyltransferase [Chloroflexota bacterium]